MFLDGLTTHTFPRVSTDRWRRLRRYLILGVIAAPILATVFGVVAARRYYTGIAADLQSPELALSAVANYGGAQIYDRHGAILYRYPNASGGIQLPVRLADVSPALIAATVSTEDVSFWTNRGVDVQATLHAAADNSWQRGGPLNGRGGSGITQQLVKRTLITSADRGGTSLERKLREAIYAIEITRHHDKTQILEWYLNVVNYGGMYDGVESASQGYFGIPARDLNLAQAAMLAGIPQSPTQHSPYLNPEAAAARQQVVLDLMVEHGMATAEEAEAARGPLPVKQLDQSLPLRAPWFVEHVRQELIARFGAHCVATCGLAVSTTIDMTMQDAAAAILEEQLAKHGDAVGVHNGALLSIDARSGEILVMIGSRRYDDTSAPIQGSNNFATAVLQPGSAFKPFVYLSLFMERGYGPDSVIWDAPFVTADGYRYENPQVVGRALGPIPVRLALGSSLNCAANRAASTAGVANVIRTAEALGFSTLGDPSGTGPSIATGGANVSLLELAYGYTTLARNGSMIGSEAPHGDRLRPTAILEVHDAVGRGLYHYEPREAQVIPAADAYLITNIISTCENRRLIWGCDFPAFRLADGRPVAVKTGTQQAPALERTSANWQFMYTPQLVTGGWVGNADRSSWTDRNGGASAVGYAVRDLHDVILDAYEMPALTFVRPADVVSIPVHVLDRTRGAIVGCGVVQQGLFARASSPDINNRFCVGGQVRVPAEQLGTGGLGPYVADRLSFVPSATFVSPVAQTTVGGAVAVVLRPSADDEAAMRLEWGAGADPAAWTEMGAIRQPGGGLWLGSWSAAGLPEGTYTIRAKTGDIVKAIVQVAVGPVRPVLITQGAP